MGRITHRLGVVAALLAGATYSLRAAPPAFEVASVKPADPFVQGANYQNRGGIGTPDPGRITYPRTTLISLLMTAYDVKFDQIQSPAWMSTEQYTVVATMPPDTTKEDFNLMLRRLLAERFGLTLHHGTKNFPAYALVVAKGGPKIKPEAPGVEFGKEGFPKLGPRSPMSIATGNGTARSAHRQSMAEFAARLGFMVRDANGDDLYGPTPRVVDRTGLTGTFEFTLEYASEFRLPAGLLGGRGGANPAVDVAGDPGGGGPTIFTALEKQLGLRLEKGPGVALDVLIVDHADKVPTGN